MLGVVFFIGAPKKNEKPVKRVFQNLAFFLLFKKNERFTKPNPNYGGFTLLFT